MVFAVKAEEELGDHRAEADEAEGAVFVEPLCGTHDFNKPLQNTVMHGTYAWHGKDMESGLRAGSVYD